MNENIPKTICPLTEERIYELEQEAYTTKQVNVWKTNPDAYGWGDGKWVTEDRTRFNLLKFVSLIEKEHGIA